MVNPRDTLAVATLPLAGEKALWKKTKRGEQIARGQLIEAYLPFARILAGQLFSGRIDNDLEFDEYLQFATVGLIEAVDRYDPTMENLFKTFASHRIKGAVLSGLEHLSEKREQIATHKRLQIERRDSVKTALDQKDKDVFQQLAEVAIGLALGFILEDPATYQHDDALAPENQYTSVELRQMREKVRALVESLPQQERVVIKYHYLNAVPFATIAETLDVTKGRVAQIHRKALQRLRETIKSIKACDVAW